MTLSSLNLLSYSLCDLGITLDSELTFFQHVNSVASSCYYQLRQLRVVLLHAFVTSRIHHSYSMFVGLSMHCVLARLDRILQSAARLFGRIPKFSPVSTCVMCCIGCLCPSGYCRPTASLLW